MIQQMYPQVPHNYSFELNKDMHFAAAHFIPHEDAGVCSSTHGHTYFCNITIGGNTLDHMGFLVNFKVIKDIVHKRWDHTVLNDDTMSFNAGDRMPSTEMVAARIYDLIQRYLDTLPNEPKCLQVFLRETPTSYIVFRPKEKWLNV